MVFVTLLRVFGGYVMYMSGLQPASNMRITGSGSEFHPFMRPLLIAGWRDHQGLGGTQGDLAVSDSVLSNKAHVTAATAV